MTREYCDKCGKEIKGNCGGLIHYHLFVVDKNVILCKRCSRAVDKALQIVFMGDYNG